MKQSRWMSLVESIANVVVGYGVAVVTQMLVFPLFGLHASLNQNLLIGLVFTGVSLVRSFFLRRVFETLRLRQAVSSSSMAACTTNPVR
ncbi:MAG: hypothetical protein GZ093_11075 [Rhodoferax sp.]|uniref:DUF7220 family protein n=1 Tax=Rhodoferax sp. TaxID=50421 RepID=UPI0013FF3605|nr:hypothetical protein [Rhodoferax sp.]NDP39275.1 hypothetical protein [Rhodoferax sp.]